MWPICWHCFMPRSASVGPKRRTPAPAAAAEATKAAAQRTFFFLIVIISVSRLTPLSDRADLTLPSHLDADDRALVTVEVAGSHRGVTGPRSDRFPSAPELRRTSLLGG
jgi:hypothetical protein